MIIALFWLACGEPTPPPPKEPPPTSDQEDLPQPIGVDEHGLPRYDISDPKVPFPAWRIIEPEGGKPGSDDNQGRHQVQACDKGKADMLRIERPGQEPLELPLTQFKDLPGQVKLSTGRHKDDPALSLSALAEGSAQVQVFPCKGEPLTISTRELQKRPDRQVLVVSRHDMVKMLDLDAPNGDRAPKMRGVTALVYTAR